MRYLPVLAACGSLAAQVVTVSPKYVAGQTCKLEIRQRHESHPGRAPVASTTLVTVSVLEVNEDGVVLAWRRGDADVPIEVELAAGGQFKRVRDTQPLIPSMQAVVSVIRTYLGLAGLTIQSGERIRVPVKAAHPLGGVPYDTEIVFELTALDQASNTAEIRRSQDLDPNANPGSIEETVAHMQTRRPLGTMAHSRTWHRGTYTIDLATGWARHVVHVRTMESPVGRRVDTTEIRLVD